MSYSVLLASADETIAQRIRSQLSELPDIHLTDIVRSSGEVSSQVADDTGLDCLLLHEDLGPLPTHDLVREVTSRHPYLAVVLIVGDPRAEVLAAAMESGARGVISTNPSLENLENRIGNAGDWSRSMRRHLEGYGGDLVTGRAGYLVALAGAKGGTGTTTVAVHLALAASGARRTVCLVDMDLQTGDLGAYLDITHRRSIVDLADAADDLNPTVLADVLFAHRLGPHVLLAPRHGERSEDIDSAQTRQILGSLRSRYDVVIVDCGAFTTEASAVAAELADRVVITTSPDLPSLRGARRLVELWERLQIRKRDDVSVLLTQASRNSEIQPDFARKVIRLKLLDTTVPASFRALEKALNSGTPGEVTDSGFRGSIGKLLRELGVLSQTEGTAAPPSEPHARRSSSGKRAKRTRQRHERGQASVEFVAMLPAVVVLVIFLFESLMVGMAMMTASHGANEGARSAAVGNPPDKVAKDAKDHMMDVWADEAKVEYTEGGDTVSVKLPIPMLAPKLGAPWDITASAKVVHEE